MTGQSLAEMGSRLTGSRVLRQLDLTRFADLSGDNNPIHVDPEFAASTPFGRPVAHGMHLFALVMATIRGALPESAVDQQSLVFPAPTFAGSLVAVAAEVTGVDEVAGLVEVTGSVTRDDGTEVCRSRSRLGIGPPGALLGSHLPGEHATPGGALLQSLRSGDTREPMAGATLRRVFRAADVAGYVDLTGDPGPGAGAVPEPLLAGMISKLLGTALPGRGTNYLKQDLRFARAVHVDGQIEGGTAPEVVAAVRVTRTRRDRLVDLHAELTTGGDELIGAGRALVLAPPDWAGPAAQAMPLADAGSPGPGTA